MYFFIILRDAFSIKPLFMRKTKANQPTHITLYYQNIKQCLSTFQLLIIYIFYIFFLLGILLPQITSFFYASFSRYSNKHWGKNMNEFVRVKKRVKNNNIKHFFIYVSLWCVMRLIFHQSLTPLTPALCSTTFWTNKQNSVVFKHIKKNIEMENFFGSKSGIIKIYNAVWIQDQRNEMMEMEGKKGTKRQQESLENEWYTIIYVVSSFSFFLLFSSFFLFISMTMFLILFWDFF